MNQKTTLALVLRRLNYGEADRIVTVLSQDFGKIAVLAKAVRRLKSKMAGGLELFAVNELTIVEGKGELYSLRSARMKKNFSKIISSYERTEQAFSALKQINKLLETEEGTDYYRLCEAYLGALNQGFSLTLMELWWSLRLLSMLGHAPNLSEDTGGNRLMAGKNYLFDANAGAFTEVNGQREEDSQSQEVIKLWRLCLQLSPASIAKIKNSNELAQSSIEPLRLFVANYI